MVGGVLWQDSARDHAQHEHAGVGQDRRHERRRIPAVEGHGGFDVARTPAV